MTILQTTLIPKMGNSMEEGLQVNEKEREFSNMFLGNSKKSQRRCVNLQSVKGRDHI